MDATPFAQVRALRKALRTVFFDKIHDSLAIRAYQLRRSQFCVSYPLWDVFVQNPARNVLANFPERECSLQNIGVINPDYSDAAAVS